VVDDVVHGRQELVEQWQIVDGAEVGAEVSAKLLLDDFGEAAAEVGLESTQVVGWSRRSDMARKRGRERTLAKHVQVT
jgi:hypothetical protein